MTAFVAAQRQAMLHAHLLHSVHLVRFAPPVIELRPQPDAPRDLAPRLATLLTEATGTRWTIALSTAAGEQTLAVQGNAADAARRASAADHPLVRAIEAFPGARIDSVHDATADAYGLPPKPPRVLPPPQTTRTCRSSPRPTRSFPKNGARRMKNLGGLMKQAQQMQAKMQEMQAKLETMQITGESGAGMVRVTLSGKGEMKGIKLDPKLADPADMEMLEDDHRRPPRRQEQDRRPDRGRDAEGHRRHAIAAWHEAAVLTAERCPRRSSGAWPGRLPVVRTRHRAV